MKKALSLFMSIVMLISITAGLNLKVFAEELSGSCGESVTYTLNSETGLLTISGTGPMMNRYSSSEYPWASKSSLIKTIVIENGVTSISYYAFYYCSSLTSVTIPNSVTSIGYDAFNYCSSLSEIIVDGNNQNYSSQDGILFNKNKTTLIQYPAGNTRTSYTIPNSVTSIGRYAFRDCRRLTSITIPNSVTSIGDEAFYYCSSLTSVTIGNCVTSISNRAFAYCRRLTSVTIPNSVTSIGFYAFEYCSSLTSVTIPNSVTSIDNDAFAYCRRLTSVTIPNSVTSIEQYTFQHCSSLTSVTIPNSVTSIGNGTFSGCSSLTDVFYLGTQQEWNSIRIGRDNESLTDVIINFTDGTINGECLALGHDWTAATCTEPKTCSRCGDTEGEALGHSFTNYVSNDDATCTSNATETATCDRADCGGTDTREIPNSALNHDWTTATCTSPKTCNRCGKTEGSALGHDYRLYENSATCTKSGFAIYVCTRCSVLKAEEVEALGHSYVATVVPATCTTQGYATYTCSVCDNSYNADYIGALGHSFTNYVSNDDATCTSNATETATCDRADCGVTDTREIPNSALGHDWAAATCTSPKTCNTCGVTDGEALGHDWADATCTAPKTCNRCDATEGTALGHDWTAATCTAPKTCNRCDVIEGEALGHDWTAATCTAPKTCNRCSKTEGSALGHDWADATCTAPKTCSTCGVTDGAPLGHSYVPTVVPASCTTQGCTTYTCSVCGDNYNADYIGALGHSFGANNPTCAICGASNPNYVAPTQPTQPTQPTTQPTAQPKSTSIKKLTKGKKSFKATWKKISGVNGYQVQYSTDKKFKKNTKTVTIKKNTASTTVKKLKANKKYYVRVRSYKNAKVGGKTVKVYSSWSKVKTVKTK